MQSSKATLTLLLLFAFKTRTGASIIEFAKGIDVFVSLPTVYRKP